MNKFYCNKCEEEVILENGKCPKCKTNWDNIINDNSSDAQPFEMYPQDTIKDNDNAFQGEQVSKVNIITEDSINKNINFFLKWATMGKYFMIIMGILIAFLSLMLIEQTDGSSLILLFFSVGTIFYGIIFENTLKWKAYMLHTNMKKKK